jgi:EF hand domain-containing protein
MRILKMTLAAAALVAIAGWASANENATTTDKVRMLDTDMDGQVSLTEYTASGKTQEDFAKIDVNADGFVNAAEMEVGEERGPVPGEKKDSRAKAKPQTTIIPQSEPTDKDK